MRRMLIFILAVGAVIALTQVHLSNGEPSKPRKPGLIYYVK
jgi:hypothetical protein